MTGEIRTLAPGFLTTVQDLGRYGYGELGVSPSGAADAVSLRMGNRLVGNDEGAPALEMTLAGGSFAFELDAMVALTGSDFGPALGNRPIPMWESLTVRAGEILRMGGTREGARCYLCVRGGIDVPLVLGSASTHLLTGIGGVSGRALRKGDGLGVGRRFESRPNATRVAPASVRELFRRDRVRVTSGPQSDWFDDPARSAFHGSVYRVTEESDRMGLRLEGTRIEPTHPGDLVTEGVALGAIQVPPHGHPIVLFVEHQTTGGYPKIANVISADLHLVGQLRPRDALRFEQVGLDRALALLCEREKVLDALLA